jgi:hypothetical protein
VFGRKKESATVAVASGAGVNPILSPRDRKAAEQATKAAGKAAELEAKAAAEKAKIAASHDAQMAKRMQQDRSAAYKLGLTVELYRGLQVELARRKSGVKPKLTLSAAEVTDAFQQLAKAPAVIVRQYRQIGVDAAAKRFSEEAPIMAAHGYLPATQSFNAVRVFGPGTGSGFLTVSYVRRDSTADQPTISDHPAPATSAPAAVSPAQPTVNLVASVGDRLRQLAALRDEGIVSAEEFEAKKADLLRQL